MVRNVLFRGEYQFTPTAALPSIVQDPGTLQPSESHLSAGAPRKASADGARPSQESRSRALRGWVWERNRPKRGDLAMGNWGEKHREKGQAASSNPESSSCLATGRSPAPLSLPSRAGATRLPPVRHICPGRDELLPRRLPLRPPQPGATTELARDGPALCHPFPPDLQLQLQDLCSSCSLPEDTRLLVGVTSSPPPSSHPREPLKAAKAFIKTL